MADVFGREDSPFAGAFAADRSKLQLGDMGGNAAGSLVQNLQVNYNQQVNQIFEVGSSNRYYVVGRTNGNITFGRVVGPKIVALELLQRLGNVCQGDAASHRLKFTMGSSACNWKDAGGAAGKNIEIIADAVVATSVGYAVSAQDMLINENVQCICGQVSRSN
jgi:hypothetical protein